VLFTLTVVFFSSTSNCKVAFQPLKRVGDTWEASKPTCWKRKGSMNDLLHPCTYTLPATCLCLKTTGVLVPEIQNNTGNKSNSSEIYLQIFNSLGRKVISSVQRYNQLKNYPRNTVWTFYSSWSFQPFWNICERQIPSFHIISPIHRGEKNQSKSLFNHHLGSIYYDSRSPIPIPITYRGFVPWSIYAVIATHIFWMCPPAIGKFCLSLGSLFA